MATHIDYSSSASSTRMDSNNAKNGSNDNSNSNSNNNLIIFQKILFCPAEERTARELQELSSSEREQVFADMTGHTPAIHYRLNAEDENQDFVREQLAAMDGELNRLLTLYQHHQAKTKTKMKMTTTTATTTSTDSTAMYSSGINNGINNSKDQHQNNEDATHPVYPLYMAVLQNPKYVFNQRIVFLRAENFQPLPAVQRMLYYFQHKLQLFGMATLGRDIVWDDLSNDDIVSLQSGGVQLLPLPDHATRGIFFTRAKNYVYSTHANMLRAFFYVAQHAIATEHFQKVGFISLSYQAASKNANHDDHDDRNGPTTSSASSSSSSYPSLRGYDFELTRKIGTLVRAMPLRFVAIYMCYDETPWKNVADLISHLVSPLLRVRLRSIQGSHQECLYKLIVLGIPPSVVPINDYGERVLDQHFAFLQHCRQKETQQQQQQREQQQQQQQQQGDDEKEEEEEAS